MLLNTDSPLMRYLFTAALALSALTSSFAQGKDDVYKDGEASLQGYLSKSAAGKAGVVILPAWMGVTAHEKETADKLSKLGYNALVADIYGVGNTPKTPKEAGGKAGYYKSHIADYQRRIKQAVDELIKQGADPQKLVVMGYCFGGTGALEAARAGMPVKAVVSVHGGLGKDSGRANGAIVPKVLVLHGADDPHLSLADITAFQQEMRDGHADWQMIYYANSVHAFSDPAAGNDNSKGAAYNALAARRSWEHLLVFLKEVVGE